jgi:4-carboxymuconolactone decarboxylase
MARISYVNEISHPELQEVIQVIREQRRGKLIPVYGLLLHSPEVAKTWMELLNAVRWKTTLSSRIREIAIIRAVSYTHLRAHET